MNNCTNVRSFARLSFIVFFTVVSSLALQGCAHGKKSGARDGSSDRHEKAESSAETAVAATNEDERLVPAIQRDMNAIFFREKQLHPGGVNAFAPERIEALEEVMKTSELKSIRYYLENREFFDRVEDSGGGFRLLSNAKRLTPYRWAKAGRRKLFEMDTVRVRESVANPCFPTLEDCGEYSSDATENFDLLAAWAKKYSEPEFADDREKLLREYAGALRRYEERVLRKVPEASRPRAPGAKAASFQIGAQRRAVEALMKGESP